VPLVWYVGQEESLEVWGKSSCNLVKDKLDLHSKKKVIPGISYQLTSLKGVPNWSKTAFFVVILHIFIAWCMLVALRIAAYRVMFFHEWKVAFDYSSPQRFEDLFSFSPEVENRLASGDLASVFFDNRYIFAELQDVYHEEIRTLQEICMKYVVPY